MANGLTFSFVIAALYLFSELYFCQAQDCKDLFQSSSCRLYRSQNLCESSAITVRNFIKKNCRKTCGLCIKAKYQWSDWSEFYRCSRSCGGGRQRRTRYCISSSASRLCPGSRVEIRSCAKLECPKLNWTNWTPRGECSVSCGGGVQEEKRECLLNGTSGCSGKSARKLLRCNTQKCPEWSQWAVHGTCSASCGGGVQEEQRHCKDGPGCIGSNNRTFIRCNAISCSEVKPWTAWSGCSASCGNGHQIRTRMCGKDYLAYEHRKCSANSDCQCESCCADSTRFAGFCQLAGRALCSFSLLANICKKSCNQCPNTCPECTTAYSQWSSWKNCTAKCDGGMKLRFRACNKMQGCGGHYYQNATCATNACQGSSISTWGSWEPFGNCSAACEYGILRETRKCQNGTNCNGRFLREVKCITKACEENGIWSKWVSNGTCSKSCGGGKRKELRFCENGTDCVGNRTKDVDCNVNPCPTWDSWKPNGTCSATCGGGKQKETRNCTNGPGCVGNSSRYSNCNSSPCPYWGNWTDDGSCSASCGPGTLRQSRICINGPDCKGEAKQEISCNQGKCNSPVWGDWKSNETCSVTCGGGTKTQTRTCINGPGCSGQSSREVRCNEERCPAAWGSWISQGACSVTCGGGTQKETRSCHNGPGCQGNKNRTVICNTAECFGEAFKWGEWNVWSRCPVSCGSGIRRRSRICLSENHCVGESTQEDYCAVAEVCSCVCPTTTCKDEYEQICSTISDSSCKNSHVYRYCLKRCGKCSCDPCGTWGPWRDISECTKLCGGGTVTRERSCPKGKTCNGSLIDNFPCNLASCNLPHWTSWSEWSDCTVTCNGGKQIRKRNCSAEKASQCGSSNDLVERKFCNTLPCNEIWSDWNSWGECSVSCGLGVQQRYRSCTGENCNGNSTDGRACNIRNCPLTSSWSSCSRSCGSGTKFRRVCEGSKCEVNYDDCGGTCPKASCSFPMKNRYKSRDYECCHDEIVSRFDCGISLLAASGRIINGVKAELRKWPWMVLLRTKKNNVCGGTLITRYIVLTAAHCVSDIPADSITLRLGALHFDDANVHVQVRSVAQIHIHPRYSFPENDIAILQLSTPAIVGGSYVRTLCLPKNEDVPNDTTCVAAGWGLTESSQKSFNPSIPDVLQEVELRVLNFDVCLKGYQSKENFVSKMREDSMVCAGRVMGGVDTCGGDSGGPLMCQRCSSCAWFLHGLTSFGSVNCGVAGKPGVYTKVSHYTDFINDVARTIFNSLPPAQRRYSELDIANGNFSSCS